jgi:hypothetical protein
VYDVTSRRDDDDDDDDDDDNVRLVLTSTKEITHSRDVVVPDVRHEIESDARGRRRALVGPIRADIR